MSQPQQPDPEWAAYREQILTLTAPKPKREKKPVFIPSTALKLLNDLADRRKREEHPDKPRLTKSYYRDDTTNGLTECVMAWLELNDHAPARINTTGIYDEKMGRYRKSGATVGVPDILASVEGRFVGLEIKFGADKLRPDQIAFAAKIRKSGGVFVEVRTFDGFMAWYNNYTRPPFQ